MSVVIFSLLLRLRGVDPVRQAGVIAGLRARCRLGVAADAGHWRGPFPVSTS
jgi:hypothetical protein